MNTRRGGRLVIAAAAILSLGACEPATSCEEDIRAQVLDEHLTIEIGAATLAAELADEAVERDRGWKHRRCDRVALLLIPDEPDTSLAVWGCGLSEAIDAYFVSAGEVAAIERIEPCPEPCTKCPLVGEALAVEAVLEVPADALTDAVELGSPLSFKLP
ncbi:hypothetical protein ENSA5_00650 [Enhygromyxa salina]|uniref:Lipoprotein n=1 Tax=Enhygromyxa salina TaxID=215803 RepID=A0A2S9YKU1_9BACT|nr:DUF192 domain-containing protein [Enhygromyxa salina]PRQ05745.1 hypothetical protein ENSA5_00650 [Enhygromyxa salina]